MRYIDLVNKVLDESGTEFDQLTVSTWNSLDSGRRLYPRVKRLVTEAWKQIQMSRSEWLFKTTEMHTVVYPRVKFNEGSRTAAPSVGSVWRGESSGFQFTVRDIINIEGTWPAGNAYAQFEFESDYVGSRLIPGEKFVEVTPNPGDGEFTYLEKGSYDFQQIDPLMRNIQFATFVASQDLATPIPVTYIPWENWLYQELSFTQGSRTVPTFFSQDYQGNIVFYPQTLDPFRLSFVYERMPQIFTDPEDEPLGLEIEYHDWIAWQAIMNLARFDKNPDLFSYAQTQAKFYESRAESSIMPIPSWGPNKFNYPRWP